MATWDRFRKKFSRKNIFFGVIIWIFSQIFKILRWLFEQFSGDRAVKFLDTFIETLPTFISSIWVFAQNNPLIVGGIIIASELAVIFLHDFYIENKKEEIDISIKPYVNPKKDFVGLEIANNNLTKPVKCKAYIDRMEYFKVDPKEADKWVPVEIRQYGVLWWINTESKKSDYKKIFGNPEVIEIACYPLNFVSEDRNFGHIIFHFKGGTKDFLVAKYRIKVSLVFETNKESKFVEWKGYIDMPNIGKENLRWMDLNIWECKDAKNWK